MPRQHITTHIAILGCVCLGLLAYLFHLDQPVSVYAGTTSTAQDFDSPGSVSVVVNKQRPLGDPGYVPAVLIETGGISLRQEAAEAFAQMARDAEASGVAITAVSGFRTAESQARLHDAYTGRYGTEVAESISALPGQSEHQTGLAVDIGASGGECSLKACFEGTAPGAWAAANAQRYGFIIRYPAGAEHITGYAYEPWHLRYVGPDAAGKIHGAGITLEEYAGLYEPPGAAPSSAPGKNAVEPVP
ncbi:MULTISPECIES: M15 family metallopeptidase [unclassified Arthrobacter]|uniref:M15 family metallopeptidase n=1 Tax=unclassified Arthrobacter TaxID=235627 RepID=UPI001E5A3BD7|nr:MULTISPECIES: M15 family metallopeptidase [unclassified Arthrobacter]MCC9145248.1 M15 family metallopeptidase [Arthrobacter sp. zg-Y919]MDK1276476.1 M15 family metallopeptidase [Arthrobacter sp. zg.Y919]WIB01925.1 M15 family metallopeptidase [Arthrobacter sp. zg-Y919]